MLHQYYDNQTSLLVNESAGWIIFIFFSKILYTQKYNGFDKINVKLKLLSIFGKMFANCKCYREIISLYASACSK